MIYEVTNLTNEELLHLYIQESTHLQNAIERNTTYNFVQSLKLTVAHLNDELTKREGLPVETSLLNHGLRA